MKSKKERFLRIVIDGLAVAIVVFLILSAYYLAKPKDEPKVINNYYFK